MSRAYIKDRLTVVVISCLSSVAIFVVGLFLINKSQESRSRVEFLREAYEFQCLVDGCSGFKQDTDERAQCLIECIKKRDVARRNFDLTLKENLQ